MTAAESHAKGDEDQRGGESISESANMISTQRHFRGKEIHSSSLEANVRNGAPNQQLKQRTLSLKFPPSLTTYTHPASSTRRQLACRTKDTAGRGRVSGTSPKNLAHSSVTTASILIWGST